MLMTFPTKESLIRNLNERDVSEVFLIIANFKSLAGWNLIPLRNLTILLGPNSAGKSVIYEAIEAIRDFSDEFICQRKQGYRSFENGARPCFGFSMPFILDGRVDTDSLDSLLIQITAPFTGLHETDCHFSAHFIIEGMVPGGYLYESLRKVRYTLIGDDEHEVAEFTKYEVYLGDDLASRRTRLDAEDRGAGEITAEIMPIADSLLYYPSLDYWRSGKKTGLYENDIASCIGYSDDLYVKNEGVGKIRYLINFDNPSRFSGYLPNEVYDAQAENPYGSNGAAFSMLVALYSVCYHRFIEYTIGIQSKDIRDLSTGFDSLISNNIKSLKKSLDITPKTWVEKSAHEFAENFITPSHLLGWKIDISGVVNRWLRESAFLDSPYQILVDISVKLPAAYLSDRFSIKKEYLKEVRSGKNVEYEGRVILMDKDGRKLDIDSIGAGYGQVLPLLIGLCDRTMLVFKQPEVHLHPRLQSRVADCFVETVFIEKQVKSSRVRIIETHSEHFVLRLLRRLRESSFDELFHSSLTVYPEDVAFIYFQPKGSSTLVHQISVLPSGEFVEGWPDGFFDERDEDLWGTPSPRGR
jgi:hypothetical protein